LITVEVCKHSHGAVRLLHFASNKLDATALINRVITFKIVCVKKQENAATRLIPDERSLLFV